MEKPPAGFRSTLPPVLFLAVIFLLNFLCRIIYAPLMPGIEKDLGISHGQAGSLFFLITSGYFIAILGSGFVSSRFTHRWTIIASAALSGAALLWVSFSSDLRSIRAGLFLVGLCAGLYFPSGLSAITHLVDPKHWGKALAIHELGPNLAFMSAPLLAELFSRWMSWHSILVILGAASVILAAGFALFGRGGEFRGQAPTLSSFSSLAREPVFWVVMALFALGLSASMGIYAMLPLYLVAGCGMDGAVANTLVGVSRIPGLGISYLAGMCTDRMGAGRTLFVVFLLMGTSTILLGALPGSWVFAAVLFQPALAACFFPPALAALSSIGGPETRNVAASFTIPLAWMFGGGAVPLLIGMMADAGSFALGIIPIGVLILGGALLSLAMGRVGARARS